MSLQFIIGSSGSGKSCYAYQNIIEQALSLIHISRVIVPDGNGAWMDNEGNRFTFSSQYDCDVYEEDGTSFYWHGEAADVYYMPVQ